MSMAAKQARPTRARSGGSSVKLIDQIHPGHVYSRAANLERHVDAIEHYMPTGRALDVLRRLVATEDDRRRGTAWSLTGPYGAGKSSFALFLRVLLGPSSGKLEQAERSLRAVDEDLTERIFAFRSRLGAADTGFILATATCQQEPVADCLLRAFTSGAQAFWESGTPKAVASALNGARRERSARALALAAESLASHAPLLLVLDEFGKTLEHFAATAGAGQHTDADLFALQEIAERASGPDGARIFLYTLQHLAFDDYVRRASVAQRREWGKIQGRFEDLPFLESPEQTIRLIAGAFDASDASKDLLRRRDSWAGKAYTRMTELGLSSAIPGGAQTLADCYPLHPAALLALPVLCSSLGQHGRTLFNFIASAEPSTVASFLRETPSPESRTPLPEFRLQDLYDYFAGSAVTAVSSNFGTRWKEIEDRIREASGLRAEDVACLKVVGLLNVLGQASGLRASADIAAYALGAADRAAADSWRMKLRDLESRGWVTYRGYADEYRLWQGSDVDLRAKVFDAQEQLRSTSAAELLNRLTTERAVVASKHSQKVGMLRYFKVGYADETTGLLVPPSNSEAADGSIVYFLGDPEAAARLTLTNPGGPVVLATSDDAAHVRDTAIEVAAALAVLDQPDVNEDRVARRELQDRAAEARNRLLAILEDAFRPNSSGVHWHLLTAKGLGAELPATTGLSRLLSDVCEEVFHQSPEIRNEMLGRRELTSQGAKARRLLLDAMIAKGAEERLGIEGFGPERAMYEATLRYTGIHRLDEGRGTWHFTRPRGSLTAAWGALRQSIQAADVSPVKVSEIYDRLMAPPIGLKEGPIPVVLAAFLLASPEDVAIYEDGTFQPSLTADLMERLIKSPQRFSLKKIANAGARRQLLFALEDMLAQRAAGESVSHRMNVRNGTVLAVASPLLRIVRSLPTFTIKTESLSERAQQVRSALLEAREPDQLLFTDLPRACQLPPFGVRERSGQSNVEQFVMALDEALDELEQAYDRCLADVGTDLAAELGLPAELSKLRTSLQVRGGVLEGKVLDPRLRAFVFTAVDEGLDDQAWLEAMGLCVSDRPPASWRDEDRQRFMSNLHSLVGSFRRLEALHFEAAAANTTDGFEARRLTLTSGSGRESSKVVYVDAEKVSEINLIAHEALERATEHGGAEGRDALLAVVAELVLGYSSQSKGTITTAKRPISRRKGAVANG